LTDKEKEELRKYRVLRESLKKSQKKYREKKTEEGLARSSVWVRKDEERAIALPIGVVNNLEGIKLNHRVAYAEAVKSIDYLVLLRIREIEREEAIGQQPTKNANSAVLTPF
jgi:hypothetical protein